MTILNLQVFGWQRLGRFIRHARANVHEARETRKLRYASRLAKFRREFRLRSTSDGRRTLARSDPSLPLPKGRHLAAHRLEA